MGYLENGMASGLGILALNSGEKYKGYFDRNYRHGKGVSGRAATGPRNI